ncbi:putative membrane protein [Campylobacter pinnipediorum subsp. pinnipediorum]|uniref:peptidase M50 n=1 Tax=Campylobacter pinnipediorum TaxID=1965231 RepID=UPI000995C701|nr:peptidase M50 [Campylobacter pinnipediorum]AQW81551.1 putative membrane protein [Campylobacter pinnipediorum subsp. pinnipediorum]
MILNTFAPPFRLVGGYFLVGLFYLLVSIFLFFYADFNALTSLNTAGFFHVFFVGFVLSIIIGALYQLTSVILESAFFSIKGAYLNLFIYAISLLFFSAGMVFANDKFLHIGSKILFTSLLFFAITFFLSFLKGNKRSFASFALFISSLFLIVGLIFGLFLALIFAGKVSLDFELMLRYHIYFVIGFIFFVIIGAGSVLLPMFALSHKVNFLISKISIATYILSGFFIFWNIKISLVMIIVSFLLFVIQAILILKNRVRKAFDYWNLNLFLSFISLIIFCFGFDKFGNSYSVFIITYGFLYPFIVAHFYKIVPFLVWYHYVSPFVGKQNVPLLDDMVKKNMAYSAFRLNLFAIFLSFFWLKISILFLFFSIFLVCANTLHIFKFTKFGVKNER